MTSKKAAVINQPRERKIFLNSMNSWFSNFVIEEFRTDYLPNAKTKNIGMGTLNTSGNPLPRLFEPKITKIELGYNYNQEVFANDIFIYNLDDSNGSEVEFIIKGGRSVKYETEKTLIGISNILTWGKTPLKTKTQEEGNSASNNNDEEFIQPPLEPDDIEEEKEEEEDEENKEGDEKAAFDADGKPVETEAKNIISEEKPTIVEAQPEATTPKQTKLPKKEILSTATKNPSQQENKKVFYYKDTDYMKRVPGKKYFQYKVLETLALTHTNPMLKVYVICPGFIYGCGEDFFFDYFRMAWLGNPSIIPIVGEGANSIPTIHILDLIQVLRRVVDKKPLTKYIIACDKTKNTNGKSIIKAISKSVGNGKVKSGIEFNIDEIDIPNYTELAIDVKVKPSKIILDEKKKQDEDYEDYNKRRFPWHCENGIIEATDILRKEFNGYRGLKNVKITVLGPPSAGKSHIAEKIAGKLRIPCLKLKDIINWAMNLENDLGKEIQSKGVEMEEVIKKAQDDYDHRKNKRRTDPPFDPTPFRKFPQEGIIKIVKDKITSNECLNLGYVLDGYPKTYQDAVDLYTENNTGNPINTPDSVIYIGNCTEDALKTRVKSIPDYTEKSGEYDTRFARRYHEYKLNNETEGTQKGKDFFSANGIDIYEYDSVAAIEDPEQEYSKAQVYLNRNGPINNFERLTDDVEVIEDDFEIKNEEIRKDEVDEEDDQELNNSSNMSLSNFSKKDEENHKNKDDGKPNDKSKNLLFNEDQGAMKGENLLSENAQNKSKQSGTTEQKAEMQDKVIQDKGAELKEREKKLLEKKSEVLRRYLSNNVIPLLAKGILNVAQNMPDDPVEALANYGLDNSFNKQMSNSNNSNSHSKIGKEENEG